MKRESIDLLVSLQAGILFGGSINMSAAKDYIQVLPVLYDSDLEFRLLFDWHFSPSGRKLLVPQAIFQ